MAFCIFFFQFWGAHKQDRGQVAPRWNYFELVCRFGSRSARIFRLLLRKRHLEQKQVEDFAMIPAKEAKDMLYTLLSHNLVQLQVHARREITLRNF